MKSETLIHFAFRAEQSSIEELQKLASFEERTLGAMSRKALKVGIETIRKRNKRAKR